MPYLSYCILSPSTAHACQTMRPRRARNVLGQHCNCQTYTWMRVSSGDIDFQ